MTRAQVMLVMAATLCVGSVQAQRDEPGATYRIQVEAKAEGRKLQTFEDCLRLDEPFSGLMTPDLLGFPLTYRLGGLGTEPGRFKAVGSSDGPCCGPAVGAEPPKPARSAYAMMFTGNISEDGKKLSGGEGLDSSGTLYRFKGVRERKCSVRDVRAGAAGEGSGYTSE